jgi:hypothetical protein
MNLNKIEERGTPDKFLESNDGSQRRITVKVGNYYFGGKTLYFGQYPIKKESKLIKNKLVFII